MSLPASLVDIAEVLGLRVALRLMDHFGGEALRIPKRAPDSAHPLVRALGPEDAAALCAYMGDAKVYVPHGRVAQRRRNVSEMEARGLTRSEIARTLGLSERHVRRLANGECRGDDADAMADLFDPPSP